MKKKWTAFMISAAFTMTACGPGLDPGGSNDSGTGSGGGGSTSKKIFITADVASGNLAAIGGQATGTAGADAICQSQAGTYGITTAKAMLSDNSTRIACTSANCSGGTAGRLDWVLAPNTLYTRVDGTVIGTTTADAIFDLPLTNAVSAVSADVWTGLSSDWRSNASACGTFNSTAGNGVAASGNSKTSTALYGAAIACTNATFGLYCVEQ